MAVAEELHFGRAADRLHLAQPVLSRQIRQLETELQAQLLTRTNRRVELTESGRALLESARALLTSAQSALRAVREAAPGMHALTIGFMAGVSVTPALRHFSAEWPDVHIDLRRIEWYEQADVLLEGRVDVAFLRRPFDESEISVTPLFTEPRAAAVSIDHPLAGRGSISIDELCDDPVIVHRGADAAWTAFSVIDPRPDGRHPRPGPVVGTMDEKLENIAAGRAIAFAPLSTTMIYRHPGVVYIHVEDIEPSEVCIAHSRPSPVIEAFEEAACAVAREEHTQSSPSA